MPNHVSNKLTVEPWIGLVLEKGHKKKLAWILMDPEGNGVGHLDIVEEK